MTAQSFDSIGAAWRLGRAVQRTRRPTRSYVAAAVHGVAKRLPTWQKVRTTVVNVVAFSSIDFGLFYEDYTLAGFIATGVSVLALDLLSGRSER